MLIPVVLALFTAAAPPQDSARGVIRGTVQSEPTGLPVPLAVVEAEAGQHTVHAIADSTGAYRLRVSAGTQTLRVRHLEHAPVEMEVLVPAAGELVLDIVLPHRPIALAPIWVRPPADPRADSTAVSRSVFGTLEGRTIGGYDPLASTLTDGFLSDPADPGSVNGDALYVRGSAANLQLVLLDGAPVYAPFHIGGLIETFEPEVMGNARMYLGGAPARYDGGLSYVMDLSTRSGREHAAASGSVDMVSATGRVEGPVGGARYLGSLRTVHGTSLSPLEGEPFPYDFADGLVRVDVPLPEGGISTTLFANVEGVRVDTLPGGRDRHAQWGNVAGSVRYRGRFEGADVEATLAVGRYDADMPLQYRRRHFQLVGRSDRIRAGVDFLRDETPVVLRYGASFERTWVRYRAYEPAQVDKPANPLLYNEAPGVAAGGYMDAAWQPSRRVLLRGGVRADAFSVGGVATLAPRASATWLVSDGAALTLAAGRYHQYIRVPRPLVPGATLGNFADSTRIPTNLAVAGATHLSVGLDQQMGGGVRLGLEGFYKRFHGLPAPRAVDTASTTAHTSGVDVWVRRTAGGLTGWFGYSLNWAWSTSAGTRLGTDTSSAPRDQFAGRHTLSAGVRGVAWRRTSVGVRLSYGSRLPESAVNRNLPDGVLDGGSLPTPGEASGVDLDTDAPLNAEQDAFLRLDAEISRTWNPRVAGRATQVTPYLRVINSLSHRDGLFYRYLGEDADGRVPGLGTFPLVPVFGVSWKL